MGKAMTQPDDAPRHHAAGQGLPDRAPPGMTSATVGDRAVPPSRIGIGPIAGPQHWGIPDGTSFSASKQKSEIAG